ncbi:alpha/beta hydrolase [Bifidobacterium ramosum]|uniref:Alpha/beta fold hydrolase n=1 Tax=Bifidobacterium ramosum TaxID=1798158 RepID=A0A6L4X2K8_9BIFI|nr:alpha/beta hydrolase [Bifidobacterium ramosum]KAB8287994.1 alpha/beta hydrolase [Bifidobacterium ramosum]NEG72051.1 alpha/beta fold hydrolase [Bifidobacterium ramosum]
MTIELKNTVYRAGDGTATPLVLVHAFPVDHRMWDDCAAEIIRQADAAGMPPFAVWAPDMPGAGEGPIPSVEASGGEAADGAYEHALDLLADAYVDLLHRAGYGRAVWAGLSMGGYVILDIQRRHPDAVAGFAMCDTKGDADTPQQRANRVRVADECERGHTVEPVMHFADATESDSSFKRSPEGKALFTRWINEQYPEGIAWRQRMAAGRPDLNDQLPAVTAPAAVICGDKDPFAQPSLMRPVSDAMTGTQSAYTLVADCGHFSAVEHPSTVAAALVDLMRRAS